MTLFFIPVIIMTTVYSLIVWRLWVNKVPGAEWHFASFNAQNRAKKRVSYSLSKTFQNYILDQLCSY